MRQVGRSLCRYSVAVIVAATMGGLAATAAAAHSARPVIPDRWTRSVCLDLSTWLKARSDAEARVTETLGAMSSGVLSPTATKARLNRAITQGAEATDRLISDVKSAGTPQVNNGKQVVSGYLQTLGDYGKAYKAARTAIAQAKTRDKEQFAASAQQVNAKLGSDLAAIGVDPVEELRGVPELAAGITATCGDVATYLNAKIEMPCQAPLNTARHLADVDNQEDTVPGPSPQLDALLDEEDRAFGQLRTELGACNVPGVVAPCRKPFETSQHLADLWNQFLASPLDSPQEQALEDEVNRQYDVLRSDLQAMCH